MTVQCQTRIYQLDQFSLIHSEDLAVVELGNHVGQMLTKERNSRLGLKFILILLSLLGVAPLLIIEGGEGVELDQGDQDVQQRKRDVAISRKNVLVKHLHILLVVQ